METTKNETGKDLFFITARELPHVIDEMDGFDGIIADGEKSDCLMAIIRKAKEARDKTDAWEEIDGKFGTDLICWYYAKCHEMGTIEGDPDDMPPVDAVIEASHGFRTGLKWKRRK